MRTVLTGAIAAIVMTSSVLAAEPQTTTLAESLADSSSRVSLAQSGRVTMQRTGSDDCPVGESGVRRQVFPIRFPASFRNNAYAVALSLSGGDIDDSRGFRLGTSVVNKTRDGMTIIADTWCTTLIHSATIDYIAVGLAP